MNVKVFQFGGCNKCFHEALLLKENDALNVEFISDPKSWKEEKADVSVIAGHLIPKDKEILGRIKANSGKVIGYGDCTTTGGVFALANQRGFDITPLKEFIPNAMNINSCLGEIDELRTEIEGKEQSKLGVLCNSCKRKATCEYLEEVHRQIEFEDEETCFNDLGYLCNGFIAKECKERCVDFNAPCRGCKPMVERSGIRMLGMFGTLMGNIDMATEHSEKGATDKLADAEDDLTRSLPDVVGNFFRFSLRTSGLPKGRIPPSGSLLENVFTGRLIEELPLIAGLLGGDRCISFMLKFIEPYEKANGIEISPKTQEYRQHLLELEQDLQSAIKEEDPQKYKEITKEIRKIAGNMNLSNMFFGGFRSQIDGQDNFEDYKVHLFDIIEGTYKNGTLEYEIDSNGIVKQIKIKEEKK